jgi:23S rRNA (cytosine1962-C5)-methyltransferase
MDPRHVWPDFDDAWIAFDDEDIIVVDKPPGISTQAADQELPDDLVTRMARAGLSKDGYFGVHQRLDRETSGVVLFAKRREANASLAKQFEGRAIEKKYVACVDSWTRGDRTTLKDELLPGDDGVMRVVRKKNPREKSQSAVTHVAMRERNGSRAMLDLTLETGRTHQARVQLANVGAPIAGDVLYGGSAAPRLLLHAMSIGFEHPLSGKKMRVEAKVPVEFQAWMRGEDGRDPASIYDDVAMLDRVLARALLRRYALGRSGDANEARRTTAFRIANEAGDALPELAVDVYGAHLVAQFYGTDGVWADLARRERVLDRLGALGFDGVYVKFRPKQANTLVDTRRDELAPREPVRGIAAAENLVVHEEGIAYGVRLGDGLSTGIFLDQRANRKRVRDLAGGQSVVNLFAYTCGFSVAAAAGGAWRTISVDASAVALERGRENLQIAEVLDRGVHQFVAEDAFAWLARAAKSSERHDLVVLDPPSYSTTKKRRFAAATDYVELAAMALGILRNGGRLLACTNHRGITASKFRRILFDAARDAKREVAQIKDLPVPSDFPAPLGGESHLKSALVTLGRASSEPSKKPAPRV